MKKEMAQFHEACQNAVAVSHWTLETILRENRETAYGRAHGFGEMAEEIAAFRRLPLTEYADFAEQIEAMRAGEEAVLSAYPMKHFLLTSGSSGKQKRIPLSYRALEQGWSLVYAASLAEREGMAEKRHLHTSAFRTEAGEREVLLSNAYFQYMREKDPHHCEKYVGGERLLFTKEIGDVCYVKLWLALAEPALYSIQSIFLYDVLLLLQYCKENWQRLLADLEAWRVPPEVPVSEGVRAALLAQPRPSAARLAEIRQCCEAGFDGIAKRLWRGLSFVSGIGGAAFGVQDRLLRQLLGDVTIHYFTYTSSEMLVGIAIEPEKAEYVCIPYSGFLEFLPYGAETTETKWIEELEIGKQYELIVTNFSGLYRYQLLDVVEVVGFHGEAPILRYLFRKNLAVNVAGEKTDLLTIANVVREVTATLRFAVTEYSVCVDESVLPRRYCFFLEGEAAVSAERCAEWLEDALQKENADYADLRMLGEIAPPVCYFVQDGAHAAWKEAQGKKGHSKPMPYIAQEGYAAFMKERIR